MNEHKFSAKQRQLLLTELERRLQSQMSNPPMSRQEAKALLKQLPPRRNDETVGDRLKRMSQLHAKDTGPRRMFLPLIDIERWAADSGQTDYCLPDPNQPLESLDGRFRLGIGARDGWIDIHFQTLGFAIDEFANCLVGLVHWRQEFNESRQAIVLNDDDFIAIIALDENGDGNCRVEDSEKNRKNLLYPGIGLIQAQGNFD